VGREDLSGLEDFRGLTGFDVVIKSNSLVAFQNEILVSQLSLWIVHIVL